MPAATMTADFAPDFRLPSFDNLKKWFNKKASDVAFSFSLHTANALTAVQKPDISLGYFFKKASGYIGICDHKIDNAFNFLVSKSKTLRNMLDSTKEEKEAFLQELDKHLELKIFLNSSGSMTPKQTLALLSEKLQAVDAVLRSPSQSTYNDRRLNDYERTVLGQFAQMCGLSNGKDADGYYDYIMNTKKSFCRTPSQ